MALVASILATTACQKDNADDAWRQIPCQKILVWLFVMVAILIKCCTNNFMCLIINTPHKICLSLIMKCCCI